MIIRILLLALLIIPIISHSQEKEVFGRILDAENQKPIYGANVIVLGTTLGTTTNQQGFFKFTIPSEQNTLILSYVGYQTNRIEIPSTNKLLVRMIKTYQVLNWFNLKYINVKDLPPAKIEQTIESGEFKVVEKNAEYPGGLKYFYNDLSRILKTDSIYQLLPDTLFFLKFCVETDGTTTFESFNPSIAKVELTLKNSSDKLSRWNSGEQRGKQVKQYFELPILNREQEFFEAEEPAEPSGGIVTFYKYVNQNLKYPKVAKRMGVEGKVFVSLIIEEDGNIKDVKVIKGIGAGCDEEAVRLVKEYPKWISGRHSGKAVRQKYTVPITFRL
jgi:TonB family protein